MTKEMQDARTKHMGVSGRGEIMVQEEYGPLHMIKVRVSKDLGQEKLVVGLEDRKDLGILHPEFRRTMPDKRRKGAHKNNVKYDIIKGNQWCDQMEMK